VVLPQKICRDARNKLIHACMKRKKLD
jgi:hypothetical protein